MCSVAWQLSLCVVWPGNCQNLHLLPYLLMELLEYYCCCSITLLYYLTLILGLLIGPDTWLYCLAILLGNINWQCYMALLLGSITWIYYLDLYLALLLGPIT